MKTIFKAEHLNKVYHLGSFPRAITIRALHEVDAKLFGITLNQLDYKKAERYYGAYTGAYDGVRWDVETRAVNAVPGLTEITVRVHDANDAYVLRSRRYRTPISDAASIR